MKMHTPKADKFETLEDGRTIQTAFKGVPMLEADAVRLGLITDPDAPEQATKTAMRPLVETPVGNTAKEAEVEESKVLREDSRVQASIKEVENVQDPETSESIELSPEEVGTGKLAPVNTKRKAPTGNK